MTKIKVVGGTYQEVNLDYISNNIYGSGLRATKYLLESTDLDVEFFTAGNQYSKNYLNEFQLVYKKHFSFNLGSIPSILTFKYNFALDNPSIYPNPNSIQDKPIITVSEGNIVCFGMLDANFDIDADKVVYDPQTSIAPTIYTKKNKAKELVYIVNSNEARTISKSQNINEIVNFFFESEKVTALIIKNGPEGATLFKSEQTSIKISSYKTENVYKIGSGDIFTTVFARYWFEGSSSLEECAKKASMATAIYCNEENYCINKSILDNFNLCESAVEIKRLDK